MKESRLIKLRRGIICVVAAWAMGCCAVDSAIAQEAAAPAPPAQQAAEHPSVDDLQIRIKQIEERTDLAEGAKSALLDVHRQALEATRVAADWAGRTADFDKQRQDAPQLLSEIRQELAQPASEVKPDVPAEASLQQLEQILAQHEAELKTIQTESTSLEDERKRRTDRRARVPQEAASAKQKLDEFNATAPAAVSPDESAELAKGRSILSAARKRALENELAGYDREIQSYDARTELLTARQDRNARRLAKKQALVDVWREVVNQRRKNEADKAARDAQRAARRQAAMGRPLARDLADNNAKLAKLRSERALADKIQQTNKDIDAAEKLRVRTADDERSLRDRVAKAGLSKAMGLLLRNRLETLPEVQGYARRAQKRASELANVQVELIGYEEKRRDLANIEPLVSEALTELPPEATDEERQEYAGTVRELYEARRKLHDGLIGDFEAYRDALFQLDVKESELVRQVATTRSYVLEHILWVPSTSPPSAGDVPQLFTAASILLAPSQWNLALATLVSNLSEQKLIVILAIPLLIVLLISRFWLRPYVRAQGIIAARPTTATMGPTLRALAASVFMSLRWPSVMLLVAWLLDSSLDAPPFAKAVSSGLIVSAVFIGIAILFRGVCRPEGLADAHFDMPEAALRTMRRYMLGLLTIAIPLVFVVTIAERQDIADQQEDGESLLTLGRLAFVVIHIALAVFAVRTRHAAGEIIRESTHSQQGGWVDRLRFVWTPLAIGLPIGLAVLALVGYYYTALKLAVLVQETLWMVVGFMVLHALLLRWLLITRRHLSLEQYRKRRAAAMAQAQADGGSAPREAQPVVQEEIDLSAVSLQTRALVRSLVGFGIVAGLWLVWVDVLPALNILDRVVLWTTTETVREAAAAAGENAKALVVPVERVVPITLARLGVAAVVLFISFIALRNLPGLLEIVLLQRLPLQQSSRYAVTTLSRYVITILGLVLAFGTVGITWSKVQWLAAAVTVGLGFGLQEIFANFVSGIIILFERPVRVGDIVTVGSTEGKVARIRMRATTILDWDHRELVVPNKDFITGQIINWTLSDPRTRVVIPVGIAYGSDTDLAKRLLEGVARDNPLIMSDPAPSAIFRGFGDSTLNFDVRVFLATRDVWADVIHQMHTGIDQAFRKAGIEIAFPQRDLHIRSIQAPLRLTESTSRGTLESTMTPGKD